MHVIPHHTGLLLFPPHLGKMLGMVAGSLVSADDKGVLNHRCTHRILHLLGQLGHVPKEHCAGYSLSKPERIRGLIISKRQSDFETILNIFIGHVIIICL